MSETTGEKILPQSLGLEDGNDTDEQPRRFLRLPSGHLLAYGGDNGNVSCLLPEEVSAEGHLDKSDGSAKNKFVVVQRYEDAVRCIAVSKDGKRLAIGFDTGKTQIYCFDKFICQENLSSTTKTELPVHPYVQALDKAQRTDESHGDNFLLSQDCNTDDNDLDYFAGPDLGAPARDMLFIPHKNGDSKVSSSVKSYMLAVASEAGMFVIDVASKEIMDGCDHWLEEDSKESHDQCGIRGLATGLIETCTNESNDTSESRHEIIVLASLAMDGRLCLWDLTNKKLLHREDRLCVPKKDVGEIHDADAYDRSCRPEVFHFNKNGSQKLEMVIGTPGKMMPCTRIALLNDADRTPTFIGGLSFDKAKETKNGHIQPIVAMMFCSDSLLVTSGQDGRVLVWLGRHSDSSRSSLDIQWEVVEIFQLESPATDLCVQHHKDAEKISLFSACANGSLRVFDISSYHSYLNNFARTKSNTGKKNTELLDEENIADDKQIVASNIIAAESNKIESKASSSILRKARFTDDSDEDDSISSSIQKPKNVHFLEEAEEDTDNLQGKLKKEMPPLSRNTTGRFDDYSDDEDGDSLDHGLVSKQTRHIDTVKPQPAFSPSSTPLDLKRRFLCWNHIGSATLLQGDNNRNIIDINFADSAFRRPISFTDNINFILGSVGESGGIFASDTKEEDEYMDGEEVDGLDDFNMSERTKQAVMRDRRKRKKDSEDSKPTGSSIFFYRFHESGLVNRKNKDWHLILPDGERVLGAACGDGWAAAMTK
jgi:chromosome transmission fidelity protein 4